MRLSGCRSFHLIFNEGWVGANIHVHLIDSAAINVGGLKPKCQSWRPRDVMEDMGTPLSSRSLPIMCFPCLRSQVRPKLRLLFNQRTMDKRSSRFLPVDSDLWSSRWTLVPCSLLPLLSFSRVFGCKMLHIRFLTFRLRMRRGRKVYFCTEVTIVIEKRKLRIRLRK